MNVGLINNIEGGDYLSPSTSQARTTWNVMGNGSSPIHMLSLETYTFGNLMINGNNSYSLTFVAKSNGEEASNIVLLKPFVTASTNLKIDTIVNGHVMGVVLSNTENTIEGEHYLGIKTLFINKATNEMKEILLHSPLTIIE